MRLGRIGVSYHYVVDLDNKEQVSDAKISYMEDLYSAVKYDEVANLVDIMDALPEDSADDIPGFLRKCINCEWDIENCDCDEGPVEQ